MLSVTENAAIEIRSFMDRQQMPEGCGLRLASAADGSGGFEFFAATAPEPDDAVIEAGSTRVFLEDAVVPVLDNKVLDAGRGDDGRIHFRLLAA